ncbi:MAG: glycerophosphodiester phosphodiesterase family protein [Oligoflexia bacterium]|nr:glycerophosphodiester phosphodiesterase family protein [Oligoflexia bacterium]
MQILLRTIGLVLFAVILSACTPSRVHPHKAGCFKPVPLDVIAELRSTSQPLRWASAHRGGGPELGPDNTLKVIRAAARAQLPLLEVDVREAASGELVLFHDRRLSVRNSTAPPDWIGRRVESLTWHELRSLDVGAGQTPPLLSEALASLAGFSSVLELDMKGNWRAIASKALELARDQHALRHVLFQCASLDCILFIRSMQDDAAILLRVTDRDQARAAISYRPDVVHIDIDDVDESTIAELRQAHIRVMVKTLKAELDQEWNWEELFSRGVEIIMTDYPLRVMKQRGCGA